MTDFFVRLGKSREDFEKLLDEAMPEPPSPMAPLPPPVPRMPNTDPTLRQRIERIKREQPIEQVIGRFVQLRRYGNQLIGLCRFHEDHNPSLAVYPATGTFRCYGCSKHGDVIHFLREMEHLSFSEALDALDQQPGIRH